MKTRSRREIIIIVCLIGALLSFIVPGIGFYSNILWFIWIAMILLQYLNPSSNINRWLDKHIKI